MGMLNPRCWNSLPYLMVLALGLSSVAYRASAREWVDNTGRHRVEAEFVQIVGAKVHLRKPNGKVIAVPLDRLSSEDLQLVRELASVSSPSETKADSPLPEEPAEPAKTVPTIALEIPKQSAEASLQSSSVLVHEGMTPDWTIRRVMAGLAAHQPDALWDALPESYQADVAELLPAFARAVDPELWQAAVPVLRKSIVVVHKQREFLREHPAVKLAFSESMSETTDHPSETAMELDSKEESWDALVSALVILAKSDLADREKLRSMSPAEFLKTTGSEVMDELSVASQHAQRDDFNQMLELLSQMKVTVVSIEGEEAVVRLKSGEQREDNQMVRVEGKWIPADLADFWPIAMQQARAAIAGLESGMHSEQRQQWLGTLQMAESRLNQLLAAESQQEFNKRLASLLMILQPASPGQEAETSLSLN